MKLLIYINEFLFTSPLSKIYVTFFSKEQMQVERTDEMNHLKLCPSLLILKNF